MAYFNIINSLKTVQNSSKIGNPIYKLPISWRLFLNCFEYKPYNLKLFLVKIGLKYVFKIHF